MWDIVTAYCLAISELCKNSELPYTERANIALQAIRDYSQIEGRTELITEWLGEAESLCDIARQLPADQDIFGNDTYNNRSHIGFVKHGFVLSLYCLMRASDKPVE